MSVNSATSFIGSIGHPHLPLNSSSSPFFLTPCFSTRSNSIITIMFITVNALLMLPLSSSILYHGLQQWRKKRSTSSATTVSHSDSFTYHLVIMELLRVLGSFLLICAIYRNLWKLFLVANFSLHGTSNGQIFFYNLTCLECYLAAVHPITYRNLRNERGTRIRNAIVACVWLLSFAGAGLSTIKSNIFIYLTFVFVFLSLVTISFCSLSVLWVLIRPGPGRQGGDKVKVYRSKQRAFYTIVTILAVLAVSFTWKLVAITMATFGKLDCTVMVSGSWLQVPSNLVLPLLFLHRKGKCMCCGKKRKDIRS